MEGAALALTDFLSVFTRGWGSAPAGGLLTTISKYVLHHHGCIFTAILV